MKSERKITAVIPARYHSSRFEGKPLALINGKTMIERVYLQCLQCPELDEVLIATDDERIAGKAREFGAEVIMTSRKHESGTDRIAEAVQARKTDIVVNIQGDEPLLSPETISQVIAPFLGDETVEMTTASTPLLSPEEAENPNCVKVVTDLAGFALYFSRSPIPYDRDEPLGGDVWKLHLGIYGYRKEVLLRLCSLPVSHLERREKLEQLRALENGIRIAVVCTEHRSVGVDVPEDIRKVEKLLQKNSSTLYNSSISENS